MDTKEIEELLAAHRQEIVDHLIKETKDQITWDDFSSAANLMGSYKH